MFFLQKKANTTLLLHIIAKTIANIKTGITLVSVNGTMLQKLKKCSPKQLQIFETYWAEPNEKWAKYIILDSFW